MNPVLPAANQPKPSHFTLADLSTGQYVVTEKGLQGIFSDPETTFTFAATGEEETGPVSPDGWQYQRVKSRTFVVTMTLTRSDNSPPHWETDEPHPAR